MAHQLDYKTPDPPAPAKPNIFAATKAIVEPITVDGRLQHPWWAFVAGSTLPLVLMLTRIHKARMDPLDRSLQPFIFLFATVCVLMSALYAWLGARHSRRLAQKVVGTIGAVVIVAGIGVFAYMLLVMVPS